MFDLNEKTALVTGSTGGIGEQIAKDLHAAGAFVVLSGTRLEKLEKLAKELGGKVAIVPCNLADLEQTDQLIAKAQEKAPGGHIDILVNNAGITRDGLLMRMKDEDFEDVLRVNLLANFHITRAAIKPMIKKKWGRIINITSVVGTTGNPGQANYAAAKAGLTGFTKSLAREVATRGITANCIAPGFIATPMTNVLTQEQKDAILSSIPCGFLGDPKDISAGALFLASEEARYVTGQTLHINGGMVMM